MSFYETTMTVDLGEMGAEIELPILFEYDHHPRQPEGRYAPAEPEHIEIKSIKAVIKRPCGYQDISWMRRVLDTSEIEREILESLQ
jgi:hypothetical protein